ncbi:MAG: 5-azacytidine resistance azr1 [Lasallia pustulata]|uniref:Protein phosphatase n=1 Tax=Lasallia pustulata TaxID=136370 RepID=A0A5M8Q0T9_9LECA|nr:MAG: 5-azacytidine resistance azr1 [Lasallia pustulata]
MAKIRPTTIAHFFEAFNSSKRVCSPYSRSRRSVCDTRTFSISTRVSHFTYRLAASFNAKNTRFNPKCDYFSFDPDAQSRSSITPSTRLPNSGQDAFFISNISSESDVAFGVADGVGGWSDFGIDSAHFSHGICEHMEALARGAGRATNRTVGPRELLEHAYEEVVADPSIVGGGSTACVATGGSDGVLEVANLGDSGFIQLRLNAVHYHSNPQTHAFNTPYQLSIIPPKVLARSRLFGGRRYDDLPNDASVTTHRMRHGDVLIFATDGVWDNLSPADILRIVSRQMTESKAWLNTEKGVTASENLGSVTKPVNVSKSEPRDLDLQSNLAIRITGEAKMASMNMKRDGPFAKEVQRHYPGEDFHGGKVDDVCVVVAIVVGT